MQFKTLLAFDIETIPDERHHTGEKFPKLLFHQVVAISFVEVALKVKDGLEVHELQQIRSGGEATFFEQQLLEGFFQYVEKRKPRLVTFNGRSFDLPVLKYRAMLHGISAPWLNQGESRFENYGYRYSSDWHCDLMDVMADYGASTSAKLDEISRLFGFPGKFGIDGSQVAQVYAEGGIKDIRDYCETDALNTYLVYLRYALFRGSIDRNGYNRAIAYLLTYIEGQKRERPHLGEFQEAWKSSSDGKFYLD
jgi:predicted PolB exonuclease-like 3'-5' exonuclease